MQTLVFHSMKQLLLLVLVTLFIQGAIAQEQGQDSIVKKAAGDEYLIGLFPKEEPSKLRSISISGDYRFVATYLQMDDPYLLDGNSGAVTQERTMFVGDDSQLPNLWMHIGGRPTAKTSFGMDVYMFQFLDNDLGETYGQQVVDSLTPPVYAPRSGTRLGGNLGLQLGMNLTGSYDTDIGSFTARMGGTHWYYLSDLTFASFRGYNRFMLFERNPWDPVQRGISDRYQEFYDEGINQQDLRWGNKAFHGMIIEGASLPSDFSFSFLYGKTELNGGFNFLPNASTGGRLRHDSENGFQSFNSFNSRTYSDSLAQSSIGFNIHTLEVAHTIEDVTIHAEVGAGRYYAPGYTAGWGEAINAKVKLGESILGFPFEIQYFRIAPEVINNNAVFWNTSIEEVSNNDIPAGVVGSNAALIPFASSMVSIGQMTNNRTGVNLNADLEVGKLKLALGYGLASEFQGLSNKITYSHTVNQLTRSRFWRWNFTPAVGPYQRYDVVYRDAYETVNLTDARFGEDIPRKHFSTIEAQAKYNSSVFRKDFYLIYLGRYSTVQPEFSALIPFNEDAYVRHYSSELEAYVKLSPSLIWANYFGYERIFGNYKTEVDLESRRPRNQEGIGYGTGVDLSLGKNAVFVLRHRFFTFEDKSFVLDQFSGQETMAEIKVIF
jgi:hypothetical protein